MVTSIQNGYLTLVYLSDIELYYSGPQEPVNEFIILSGEERNHLVKVMRHSQGEEIFITNGLGKIFKAVIEKIFKDSIEAKVIEIYSYINKKKNYTFCIPRLKNPERFEFALEKCAELGITDFLVFNSSRTISKGSRIDRWNKILISAMKQSLLSFLPVVHTADSINEINTEQGEKLVFDQSGKKKLLKNLLVEEKKYFFIFGPEGGFTKEELNLFDENYIINIGENRLRTETAVIKCASLL